MFRHLLHTIEQMQRRREEQDSVRAQNYDIASILLASDTAIILPRSSDSPVEYHAVELGPYTRLSPGQSHGDA